MEDVEERAGFGMRAGFELRGTADEGEVAFMEQRNASGELHRFLHVVRDEDGGLGELGAQAEEFALQIETRNGIESAEGFVEQQDFGIGGERAGNADALSLSAGKLARKAVREIRSAQTYGIEQSRHARGDFVFGPVFEPGDETDVALHGEVREQAAFLNDVADAAAEADAVPFHGGLAVNADLARRRQNHAVDETQGSGFAGAAAAEQDERFAGLDGEGQAVENGSIADAEMDITKLDGAHLRLLEERFGESPVGFDPLPDAGPASAPSDARNLFRAELVRRLGPDGFAGGERDGEIERVDTNLLGNARPKMHFDSRLALVVAGFVGELRKLEVAVEFAIDAREQIQVEGRGDADGIVIGAEKLGARLDEIRAEQKVIAGLHALADARRETTWPGCG